MSTPIDQMGIRAVHDLVVSQVKLLWDKTSRRYKISRNVKIKLVWTTETGMKRGFFCEDCGPAVIKYSTTGALAILRLPIASMATHLDSIMDETIPHGLAHIVCQLRPDLGHGYQHDNGFTGVHNWIKENT